MYSFYTYNPTVENNKLRLYAKPQLFKKLFNRKYLYIFYMCKFGDHKRCSNMKSFINVVKFKYYFLPQPIISF